MQFAGLKTFASLQSTRQLSECTSAGLGVTWQPNAGLGLQLVSSRQLSDTTEADFNWVIGPAGAAGVGLSVSRRGEKLTTSGRIEARALESSVVCILFCMSYPDVAACYTAVLLASHGHCSTARGTLWPWERADE